MDLFDAWIGSIRKCTPSPLRQEVRATAVYKRVFGARSLYASVAILVSPCARLQLCDGLEGGERTRLSAEGWDEATLFGVLDVFVLRPFVPVFPFKLTIEDIGFHEIDSQPYGFRMAGRRAAEDCLTTLKLIDP